MKTFMNQFDSSKATAIIRAAGPCMVAPMHFAYSDADATAALLRVELGDVIE